MIFARVRRETPSGKGNLRTSSTFCASIFRASFSQLAKKPCASVVVFGSRMRSKTNTTSSAVTGCPSWNLAPARSVNFHEVPLVSFGTAVASADRARG